ncbi:unnamed protein product [Linum tenue]|uniref:Uncharacterized protein n=1 Tax=Linum tenue TaxID=586396 RepID=A0AAV0PNP4_9ROSI|nr:unnamed protein product [Linum tenue]CAI0472638.1 unnamed protein product [Linum tenue]
MLIYAARWTALLTVLVAVASFSPEFAFVSTITAVQSPGSGGECRREGMVRVPLDVPGEVFCLPAQMFAKSNIDFVVPPVFAAVVVAGAAWVVRSIALWEDDEPV